ncbi:DUF167 domain-containing protein [Methermicoccus shengliensis]|uniref:UPF0235 protein HA299_02310 n=1 Tax=Methermicoccus shengliensis TaxID=660064 RepID=A0A832RSP2_9EURY|nr:DUF167 domain-containing protein [Methermicoccus shengliensis]KUK05033.1 MAG: hypothetical protein XD46_0026 [Euryarchaeota archaeon 55_53]KUK30243.1 MAG: hypothetical protein XD62_0682 [Methanosarcinales archeaon 56_1174]MDI3487583.1 uncharacterized protein [Methanosarcinales archaeon]MDN5294732.1 uncharacterized protein [Methanosarcinales archaeon]HIH69445.1 YggU family protein [Methermicoccus shengliensis]
MDAMEAIRKTDDGVLLDVEVSPSSKRTEIPAGYDAWRKRIVVKVAAPPRGGRANTELVREIARRLGVPTSSVRIVAGEASTKKTIKVLGVEPGTVYTALFEG